MLAKQNVKSKSKKHLFFFRQSVCFLSQHSESDSDSMTKQKKTEMERVRLSKNNNGMTSFFSKTSIRPF